MKKSLSISLTLLLLIFSVSRLHAADFVLFDWGFNIDGTTYCLFGPCDFDVDTGGTITGPADLPSFIDTAGFDFVAGLGSLSITISDPGSHSVLVFFDHDIDEDINDFDNETGVANGSPATGQTWEIDEPSFGSLQNGDAGLPYVGDILFDNFLLGMLDNMAFFDAADNQTLTPPDDVSMAMGRDFDLVEGETATVVFLLSETSEPQGFYLKHSDPDSPADIYFSSSLDAESVLDESGVQAFVTRFYQQCLNRDPDTGGLDYWANSLLDGSQTGSDVAIGFVFSQEFVDLNTTNEEYLTVLYRAFFDRDPDSGGYNYWLSQLNSGVSREDVLDGFISAQEFIDLCESYGIIAFRTESPALVEAFVIRFYQQCLNRSPDQAGLDYWVNSLLDRTLTGADVAWGFVFSQEFVDLSTTNEEYLTVLYRAFFDRQPDPGGFAYWLSQFNSGMSREEALCGFLNSTEFGTLCYNYGIVFGGCGGGGSSVVIMGTDKELISKSVGPSGGILEGPAGSPIDGVSINIPAGALGQDTQISIGYNDGTITPVLGEVFGPILVINTNGAKQFNEAIEITTPLPGDDGLPIPYYIDETGSLHLMDIVSYDPAAGKFSFHTFHASPFVLISDLINFDPEELLNLTAYYSDFRPKTDGFVLENYDDAFHPDAHCTGFAAFSQWYYKYHKAAQGGLYNRFRATIGNSTVTEAMTILDRAYNSINLNFFWYKWFVLPKTAYFSGDTVYRIVRNAIANTKQPVIMHMQTHFKNYILYGERHSHDVLAYAVDAGRIMIYDSNYPYDPSNPDNSYRYIELPFVDFWSEDFLPYDPDFHYTNFTVMGDGSWALAEPFQLILDDANANFHGSFMAQNEVTSHKDGEVLSDPIITLRGHIESGEMLVEKLKIILNGLSLASIKVDQQGDWEIPNLELGNGPNFIEFKPIGRNPFKQTGPDTFIRETVELYTDLDNQSTTSLTLTVDSNSQIGDPMADICPKSFVALSRSATLNVPQAWKTFTVSPDDFYHPGPDAETDSHLAICYYKLSNPSADDHYHSYSLSLYYKDSLTYSTLYCGKPDDFVVTTSQRVYSTRRTLLAYSPHYSTVIENYIDLLKEFITNAVNAEVGAPCP